MKKKVSHTPGPWKLHYNEDGTLELGGGITHYTGVDSEAGFGCVAHVIYKKTNILGDSKVLERMTFEANAKLIAAAPELLEALRRIIQDFQDYPVSERPCYAFDLAKEAIKKATE